MPTHGVIAATGAGQLGKAQTWWACYPERERLLDGRPQHPRQSGLVNGSRRIGDAMVNLADASSFVDILAGIQQYFGDLI